MKTFKTILLIAAVDFAALYLFSLTMGWNLVTLFLFWFLLVPGVTYFLSQKTVSGSQRIKVSLSSLLLFYSVMVFMIYDHYKFDYFQVMMWSYVWNSIFLFLLNVKWPAFRLSESNNQ